MLPETQSILVLREALAAALVGWDVSATLADVPAEHLRYYLHEIAFRGDGAAALSSQNADQRARGWVVRTVDLHGTPQTRRHFIVAEVDVEQASEEFPKLLSVAAKLRSHLTSDEQADIAMLLVTKPGTKASGRIAVLERNEAFVQVLVWTPAEVAEELRSDADIFVERLRLGPIKGPAGATEGDLSPVDAVFGRATMSPEILKNWRSILMNTALKETERTRRLLEVAERPVGASDAE